MKKILLPFFLIISVTAFGQADDTATIRKRELYKRDSIITLYKNNRDSLTKALLITDTNLVNQNRRTSTEYFVQLQKEIRAQESKLAITRIAIGAVLLVILVIVLRRKRKK